MLHEFILLLHPFRQSGNLGALDIMNKCDSICCGRKHCPIFTPADEIRSALNRVLIHTQPFAICQGDMKEARKPLNAEEICGESFSHEAFSLLYNTETFHK